MHHSRFIYFQNSLNFVCVLTLACWKSRAYAVFADALCRVRDRDLQPDGGRLVQTLQTGRPLPRVHEGIACVRKHGAKQQLGQTAVAHGSALRTLRFRVYVSSFLYVFFRFTCPVSCCFCACVRNFGFSFVCFSRVSNCSLISCTHARVPPLSYCRSICFDSTFFCT